MPPSARIDQPTGAGAGTDGAARDGIWLSQLVELHDVGVGSPGTRQWTLDDRPPGSAAALGGDTTATATFTPDVSGTYKFSLVWDNDPVSGFTLVLRVTKDAAGVAIALGWPTPAYLEEHQHSEGIAGQGTSGRGYTKLIEDIVADARSGAAATNSRVTKTAAGATIITEAIANAYVKNYATAVTSVKTQLNGADRISVATAGTVLGGPYVEVDGQLSHAPNAPAYAASLTLDCALSNRHEIGTLTGALALDFSNARPGAPLSVEVTQDGTGGKAVTWDAKVKFGRLHSSKVALVASSRTRWVFDVKDSTHIYCVGREEFDSPLHLSITAAAQTLTPDKINVLSTSATTATLPAASTWANQTITVKLSGLASCVVSRSGSDTIDGATTYTITSAAQNAGTASFSCDGTNIYAYPGA